MKLSYKSNRSPAKRGPLLLLESDTEWPRCLGPGVEEGFSVMRTTQIADLPCRCFCFRTSFGLGKGKGLYQLPGGYLNLTLQILQRD